MCSITLLRSSYHKSEDEERVEHYVTVFEQIDRIGGLLWRETPPFRIPRDILNQELIRFEEMGIRFELGKALGRDINLSEMRRNSIGRGRGNLHIKEYAFGLRACRLAQGFHVDGDLSAVLLLVDVDS